MIADVIFIIGFLLMMVGLWWSYPPATAIVAGLMLCVAAVEKGKRRGSSN